MSTNKESGLAAIAQSTRKTPRLNKLGRKPTPGEEKPPLELEGYYQKTSLSLDVGLWTCVFETAHILTKRMRAMGRGRVTLVKVLVTAFRAFHELTLEQQIELVRKHD